MAYNEDDFLQLSGLQHFSFCRRQWALIHIEQQWAENFRTTDGELMHKKAHDPDFQETRNGCIITRAMNVRSAALGISGTCDIVEFRQCTDGISLSHRDGLWRPFPVEYKRGSPGSHTDSDILQLCAQALCLEEMLCCNIPEGALYYGETHRRQRVDFSPELRQQVIEMTSKMHELYRRGYTPKVKPSKSCNACSLKELCLPGLMRVCSAAEYIRKSWEDDQ